MLYKKIPVIRQPKYPISCPGQILFRMFWLFQHEELRNIFIFQNIACNFVLTHFKTCANKTITCKKIFQKYLRKILEGIRYILFQIFLKDLFNSVFKVIYVFILIFYNKLIIWMMLKRNNGNIPNAIQPSKTILK